MWSWRCFLLSFAVLGLLTTCRPANVLNITDYDLGTSKNATKEDVSKAIVTAGATLGWVIIRVRPGELKGTLRLRTHVAVVKITHDTKMFSIKYKDSTNLNYDGTSIHSNYNGWVSRLAKTIQIQTTAI